MIRSDVADSAHVSGKCVDLLHPFDCARAAFNVSEVKGVELVCKCGFKRGLFHVGSPHPKTTLLQELDEMVSDETAGSGHEDSGFLFGFGHRNTTGRFSRTDLPTTFSDSH